jgi:DNA-binding transcriptional regulator YiaG
MTPKKIKTIRKRLGLTQAKLAERLGVCKNTVARWERGELSPNSKMISLALFALDVKTNE